MLFGRRLYQLRHAIYIYMVELCPGGSANCAGAMYYGIHSADQPKETLWSSRSPSIHSAGIPAGRLEADAGRSRARMCQPLDVNRRINALPINPVPPVNASVRGMKFSRQTHF